MRKRIILPLILLVAAPFLYRAYNTGKSNHGHWVYLTNMKTDLNSLASAERRYRDYLGGYTPDLALLVAVGPVFEASPGVTVEILEVTDSTFRASATHEAFANGASCTVLVTPARTGYPECVGYQDWFGRPRLAD